jgi:hypothetical protein
MLRRTIENFAFPALLGIAATYTFTASLMVVLLADGLARTPILWTWLVTPAG